MNAKSDKTLSEIEASQSAMRTCIDTSKKLSLQIDRLLKRHRKELRQSD